ncbi:MAG TPA: GDSL-type esterase/lipase family protein [Sphingobium sp.]|nr:GDSL-type esterase/lipase family protein [Sphingobium sp.]
MPTANINCARSIVTKAPRGLGVWWRVAAALALLPGLAATAAAQAPVDRAADEPRVNADPTFPFANEVAAFAKANERNSGTPGAVLFLGSSSIRLWNTSAGFPDRSTVNRGFGGATTPDVLRHYPRLFPKAAPRSVLVYIGENDLAAGATPDTVAHNVLTLLKRLRGDYPKARIAYLSLKPSPIRWTLWPKMAAVNMTVAARSRVSGFEYLDVGSSLLAHDGLPDASLFGPDGLHMNARGYSRWNSLVDGWLDRTELAAAPAPRPASLSN